MSETTGDELRDILSKRPLDTSAADYFLEKSPGCECEAAPPVDGGHGPVDAEEQLSMYIGSPRHTRSRYKNPEEAKKAGFPFKTNVFDAAFGGGLSTMREDKATNDEVKRQAAKIAEGLRRDNPKNGFFSVLKFNAEVIFSAADQETGMRYFCIYDTPIDHEVSGSEVFSHADIFPAGQPPALALRTARRVQIREAVASNYSELRVSEYREKILEEWKAEPSLGEEA